MQAIESAGHGGKIKRKEKVEAILARLRLLRGQVSELRKKCEALKLQTPNQADLICSECGKLIESGQEVALKNSLGRIKAYYHRDCFMEIWRSQVWVFDYSQPGFLRFAEDDA
ncbi:MAG: hypothetical protein N3E52_02705 [Candidatus Bathyarchaeota archaeon]|nr:hypothetical protein [Candidatus Bathyarchaeota archaeon]